MAHNSNSNLHCAASLSLERSTSLFISFSVLVEENIIKTISQSWSVLFNMLCTEAERGQWKQGWALVRRPVEMRNGSMRQQEAPEPH